MKKRKNESDILIRVSRRIRVEREKLSISQEELGGIAGLHRTYIGMLERAEKNPTIKTLERIAKALNVKLSTLLK